MSRMTWIAAGLAVVLAAGALVGWLAPSDDTAPPAPVNGAPVEFDEALAEHGGQLASDQGCTACHSIDGSDGVGPTWAGLYGSQVELVDGEVVEADDAYQEAAILDPGDKVVAGYGPSMPSYEGKLSKEELAALIEYIKSLSG